MKMFRHFPLPMMSKFRKQSTNSKGWILLLTGTWVVHWNHFPPHMHFFLEASSKISVLLIWDFWDIWDGAVSLRFAASKRSEIFVINNWQLGIFFGNYLENRSSTLQILLP